jgi:uncharacterized protein YdeI (YjbR/CyaY-like superfamily)
MAQADQLPIIAFETQQRWEMWLSEHHAAAQGIWLKLAKKETGIPSVSYAEALESALCYGWIDGQKAPCDEAYWLQKFTPRRAKSLWSKVNCAKVRSNRQDIYAFGGRLLLRSFLKKPLLFCEAGVRGSSAPVGSVG